MNLKQARQAIPLLCEQDIVPLLWGERGLGKTQTVAELAQETGRKFIALYLSTQEPGDLIGMPEVRDGKTVWARPDWWPEDGNAILFLDEINRAPRYVLSAIMPLVNEKRLHTHQLPEGVWIVAAANPLTKDYEVTEFDRALFSRFCHLVIRNDLTEYAVWLRKESGLNEEVVDAVLDFANSSKQYFTNSYTLEELFTAWHLQVSPDRRSTYRAGCVAMQLMTLQNPDLAQEILAGFLGVADGKAMWRALNSVHPAKTWVRKVNKGEYSTPGVAAKAFSSLPPATVLNAPTIIGDEVCQHKEQWAEQNLVFLARTIAHLTVDSFWNAEAVETFFRRAQTKYEAEMRQAAAAEVDKCQRRFKKSLAYTREIFVPAARKESGPEEIADKDQLVKSLNEAFAGVFGQEEES